MRKLTLILCLFITTSLQAQTKEETMTWIKEKLTSFNNYNVAKVEVSECEVKLIYNWGTETFSVRGITFYKDIQLVSSKSGIKQIEKVFAKYEGFKGFKRVMNDGEITFEYSSGVCMIGEQNIIERLQKAFNYLTTFCSKKKEVF